MNTVRNLSSAFPIAVIIPVYNRPISIFRALTSLIKQTHPPDHLVIVDDGSTDETATKIEHWCKTTKTSFTKKLIRAEHNGAAAARNKGMKEIEDCALVLFLDSDDEIPPDFFARAAPILAKEEKVVAVSIPRVIFRGKDIIFNDMKEFDKNPVLWMFQRGAGFASCSLFRLETVISSGGFDEHIVSGHDLTLFIRISIRGMWQILEGSPSLIYRDQLGTKEAANLSESYWNRFADWARVREYVVNDLLSADNKNKPFFLSIITSLWYGAARNADKSGRIDNARDYYHRALKYTLHTLRFSYRRQNFVRLAKILLFLTRIYGRLFYTRVVK